LHQNVEAIQFSARDFGGLHPPAGLSSPRQLLDLKIYLPRRPPLMRLRWTAHV
jgi:hypothetical protein